MPSACRKILALFGVALALTLAPQAELAAAPEAELWERWTAHDPDSDGTIAHTWWGSFLDVYLVPNRDGINRLAYARVGQRDRSALDKYLDDLAGVPISAYNRDEQFAYWVNLYNALTMKVILDHYPVSSITKISISPGWFSVGPWGKKLIEVEGEAISLDDIEHRILRPIWKDSRIHYAVNCAALSCPNLLLVPFTGANLEGLLDQAARDYVNRPGGIEARGSGLVVSSVYEWYKDDFGGDDAGIIAHLRQYADLPLTAILDGATRIRDDRYDWAINDADPSAAVKSIHRGSSANSYGIKLHSLDEPGGTVVARP